MKQTPERERREREKETGGAERNFSRAIHLGKHRKTGWHVKLSIDLS